jgi:hypothetical protein
MKSQKQQAVETLEALEAVTVEKLNGQTGELLSVDAETGHAAAQWLNDSNTDARIFGQDSKTIIWQTASGIGTIRQIVL